ncbi:unnamed protein product [Parascedosporium putredinis]|uniref:Clavaminate synthase-like protein n=1 Tax=Parascedosporium putredinis TaxID=1442378 RepID=A0A9P1H8R7_9PEZI|nr:unnamed protein product [Parascedosporium putredinis]CAI8000994.1 unnamed protein product [Parascedosporium putredinis]
MAAPHDLPMELPVIDLDVYLHQDIDSSLVQDECKKAAQALITYGALVLHDSRVSEDDNTTFLDLLEDYFAQPEERLREDERPELGFQVGVTLENTEKPKCAVDEPCLDVIQRLAESERPLDIAGHEPDPKCRFFWRMTEKPPTPPTPTASDLQKYGQKDTILAGFHTDLNFLTIHGRSRYPGLHIWARNTGKRIAQLEHFTGGLVKAGFHEVVVNERTLDVIAQRKISYPDRPLVRISSTFFWHLSSDFDLVPLPELAEKARSVRAEQAQLGRDEGEEVVYPPLKVGKQVESELRHIALLA